MVTAERIGVETGIALGACLLAIRHNIKWGD